MNYSAAEIWTVILAMAVGTYLIRFSFLGLIGGRRMPDWLLRHLRYAPHAVLPAMVAPMVLSPVAEGGSADPARIIAALGCGLLGWATKNTLLAILGGLIIFALATLILR
ncbi:AzlD domain-containing protein [Frigidibacter sp. ROC022]|uniref:AzlD domain-containing protein n=1 Tax=Frigidibacter sp. ROC022 TaxID=2971796 RepID=UPI00215A6411|nr:AzlD domain-containing protein [Frigidibacter sp. ROC022]MCR8724923.1 AzlD domain-containing protein [Frigidibacter sp. ROC022]